MSRFPAVPMSRNIWLNPREVNISTKGTWNIAQGLLRVVGSPGDRSSQAETSQPSISI